jgi:hypothetical protein
MTWTGYIRQCWDDLFPKNRYTTHLEDEIEYLRRELAQARLDRDKLQLFLNTVNPAGQILDRKVNPPHKAPVPTGAPVKRWPQLLAERQAEIDEAQRKKMAEAQNKVA